MQVPAQHQVSGHGDVYNSYPYTIGDGDGPSNQSIIAHACQTPERVNSVGRNSILNRDR